VPSHPSADGLPAWELLKDLRSVKLQKTDRAFIVRLSQDVDGGLGISRGEEAKLRKLYRKHGTAIARLQESRSRARVSMAAERLGLTKGEREAPIRERDKAEEKERNDLGI
tara:strand:+ start:6278 stop:6610 length:333 start_codon:yes stop_codon:yes gene_type:complete